MDEQSGNNDPPQTVQEALDILVEHVAIAERTLVLIVGYLSKYQRVTVGGVDHPLPSIRHQPPTTNSQVLRRWTDDLISLIDELGSPMEDFEAGSVADILRGPQGLRDAADE